MTIWPARILSSILVLAAAQSLAQEKRLSAEEREYHREYGEAVAKELSAYFDNENPPFHSLERRNALYLVDTLTHYPAPHDDWLKDFFLGRYRKAIDDIKKTDVQTGAVIWNVYNMAYVVKTKEITVAFDLICLPSSLRVEGDDGRYEQLAKELVDLCDVLFVSHIHGDHADAFVAGEFIRQDKPVVAPAGVFGESGFHEKVLRLAADGESGSLPIPGRNTELSLRIYPGHQQVSATGTVDNNFTVVTLPNGITVAHSGDQCWADDFDEWIDSAHKDGAIDVLMVNTWTLWPDRLIDGLHPDFTLPGHVNEMSHGIGGRIPFWKGYLSWKNAKSEVVHLFWGEPYRVEGVAKAVSANEVEE